MRGCLAIYERELLILRKKFFRQVASMSVGPLLYLIAFGLGMGKGVEVQGHSYMEFLIPGLVAMSSMIQAFAIASEINIARFYWRIFEEFQAAPIRNIAYVTGEVLAGITRALLSIGIILLIGLCAGVFLSYNIFFWLAVVLNSFLFASLAVCMAMLVKSHADQALLTNFFITPMAFLGGTFFPVDRMPPWAQKILHFLPLTHAAHAIRSAAFGLPPESFSYLLLAITGSILFVLAFYCVNKAKE
ncbi:ABC transporter permease [Desulforhabdus amnigena]|jgi:Nod factor-specific ABC transporter NodJ protein|uniref:Transport permease protein n=1 Tax=Desulforhabdus amnigena TaxID=40218 RepID=A0A9W6FU65_9BACT|nr:ABC transporter permease [Desulforhabdus amnigena]NLJ27418.1 ABC transporter permease [Deltaproteobacteria bacterium]GLI34943.1 transport permease protein [Desulforhabdus amnigena]